MSEKTKNTGRKKILFTFGEKGLWLTNKISKNIKSYNVPMPKEEFFCQNDMWEFTFSKTDEWWTGIEAFYKQRKNITSTIRNKQDIIILAERLRGFQAGFIFNLLIYSKNKKVTLITAVNCINYNNFLKYLAGKTEIIDVLNSDKYRNARASNMALFGLETCINSLYIEKAQECFELQPLNIDNKNVLIMNQKRA